MQSLGLRAYIKGSGIRASEPKRTRVRASGHYHSSLQNQVFDKGILDL